MEAKKNPFEEIEAGFSASQAVAESSLCKSCTEPKCVQGCPAGVDIPQFIKCIEEGNPNAAIGIIAKSDNLPFACSRLCPRESMCEASCSSSNGSPVQIGKLERYAYENGHVEIPRIRKKSRKIAVVGSGPAGLSCAEDLAKLGYDVTVFEALHSPGGSMRSVVPNFRLPHKTVDSHIAYLSSLGVKIINNAVVGRLITIPELKKRYSAVFIATGSSLPTYMGIEGEHLQSVITANEFLYRINVIEQHLFDQKNGIFTPDRVIVVGGNDAAIDCARMAVRLGARATVLYHKSLNELTATHDNIHWAREEGIQFLMLSLPKKYLGSSKVEGIEVIQMKMEEDEIGNKVPVEIEGSEFTETADLVILALGTTASPIVVNQTNINHNLRGNVFVDDNLMTSVQGIFSGGAVTGASTVVESMVLGKRAAKSIDYYLSTPHREVEVEND
ncbi:FAD-dependent oxidoreductase [Candidatus Woesearchaeota archaeon]|nr:FAD-dependent oxidoreductase [Candidatus Woesearchaeota archaeon]